MNISAPGRNSGSETITGRPTPMSRLNIVADSVATNAGLRRNDALANAAAAAVPTAVAGAMAGAKAASPYTNQGQNKDYGGGSGGSSSSSSGYGAGYVDYLSAALAARAEAMRRANEALDAQGRAIEQRYNNQLEQVGQDYQKLRNQSEVNRYKALRNLRETQANRGLLNSGAGRQENLNVSTAYGNNLNEIGIAENNERNQIQQAINEMWAQVAAAKAANEANIAGDFTSSLMNALGSGMYQYAPASSEDYQRAASVAGTVYSPAAAVQNGQISGVNPAAAAWLYDPDNQQTWLRNIANQIGNLSQRYR